MRKPTTAAIAAATALAAAAIALTTAPRHRCRRRCPVDFVLYVVRVRPLRVGSGK